MLIHPLPQWRSISCLFNDLIDTTPLSLSPIYIHTPSPFTNPTSNPHKNNSLLKDSNKALLSWLYNLYVSKPCNENFPYTINLQKEFPLPWILQDSLTYFWTASLLDKLETYHIVLYRPCFYESEISGCEFLFISLLISIQIEPSWDTKQLIATNTKHLCCTVGKMWL